jgi:hypothetical protein
MASASPVPETGLVGWIMLTPPWFDWLFTVAGARNNDGLGGRR